MAGRISNRRDLRRQAEAAEKIEQTAPTEAKATGTRKAAAKKPTVRKPRAPKAAPRMRAHWCIYDAAMKQVALFDYNRRADAEARLADIQARAKGVHFLRLFKDAIPQPAASAGE